MAELAPDLAQTLDTIRVFWMQRGWGPTVRELAGLNATSVSVAHTRVRKLLDGHYLVADWEAGKMLPRTLRPAMLDPDPARALLQRYVYAYANVQIDAPGHRLGRAKMEVELFKIWQGGCQVFGIDPASLGRGRQLAAEAELVERDLAQVAAEATATRARRLSGWENR